MALAIPMRSAARDLRRLFFLVYGGDGAGPSWVVGKAHFDTLANMPVISMFYGLIISMYFMDNKQHKRPHIHVRYQDDEAVFSIPESELLAGSIPANKIKLVQAWIEIHKEELMADWQLAVSGQHPYKIEPLK
jgi:hypothetical protein